MQRWGKGGQRPTGAGDIAGDAGGDRRRLGASRDGGDRRFAALLYVAGALIPGLLGLVLWTCLRQAWPALARLGVTGFLLGAEWDPVAQRFGALPFILGTLITAGLALALAAPVALLIAVFLTELAPPRLREGLGFCVELLAAIPSVVYGLWGLAVLVPLLRERVQPALQALAPGSALTAGVPLGVGYLAAGLLLALMILPTIATVMVQVLRQVPAALREAALSLGATRVATLRLAVWPLARRGFLGAVLLGLARALGEALAVSMVIGNQPGLGVSLLQPGSSLSAILANEFGQTTDELHGAALAALALVLLVLTLALAVAARLLLWPRRRFVAVGSEVARAQGGAPSGISTQRSRARSRAGEGESGAEGGSVERSGAASLNRAAGPGRARGGMQGRRGRLGDGALAFFGVAALALALAPLVSLLALAVARGGAELSVAFLVQVPQPVGGGVGNAVVGTLYLVGLAALFGLPVGFLAGLCLAERGDGRFGTVVRLTAEVLASVPSVVVGLVAYGLLVVPLGRFSALAGAAALALLLIAPVARTTEEVLRLAPQTLREAALALGVRPWRTSLFVVVPAALGGVLHAALLALSYVAGEAAPLLFTSLSNQHYSLRIDRPMASLPMQIYGDALAPLAQPRAFGATLCLLSLCGGLHLAARALRGAARR